MKKVESDNSSNLQVNMILNMLLNGIDNSLILYVMRSPRF